MECIRALDILYLNYYTAGMLMRDKQRAEGGVPDILLRTHRSRGMRNDLDS